jgi:type I restriction enzyme S subunit
MASEWRTTTLGEVIELKRGYDLPSQDRREGPYPIVSSSGVSGCHAEAKAKAPGVVIGRYGTLGEVHYITQDYWPLNTSLYVRDFKGNDPKFISYFLRSLDFGAYSDKAAVPGLNRNDLHTAVVLVPPLAEQQRIAGILGALDDKIELNRRMSQTLESMARALFKSWFVDFDPVRAKAEGLDPSLPTDPAELFAKPFQDSQLGEIPSGWRASTVGQEFRVTMGQSPPGETYNMDGAGVPFYQGRADFGNRFPSRRVYCTAPTRRALAADTLVCVRAPVGDTNQAWEDCAIGRGLAAVRHRSGATSYTYLAMRCLRDSFAAFEAGGTVFGAIGKDDLRDVPVVAPAAGVVVAFEEVAARLDDKVASAQAQLSSLMAVRDALLPVLVSGARMAADSRTEGG